MDALGNSQNLVDCFTNLNLRVPEIEDTNYMDYKQLRNHLLYLRRNLLGIFLSC